MHRNLQANTEELNLSLRLQVLKILDWRCPLLPAEIVVTDSSRTHKLFSRQLQPAIHNTTLTLDVFLRVQSQGVSQKIVFWLMSKHGEILDSSTVDLVRICSDTNNIHYFPLKQNSRAVIMIWKVPTEQEQKQQLQKTMKTVVDQSLRCRFDTKILNRASSQFLSSRGFNKNGVVAFSSATTRLFEERSSFQNLDKLSPRQRPQTVYLNSKSQQSFKPLSRFLDDSQNNRMSPQRQYEKSSVLSFKEKGAVTSRANTTEEDRIFESNITHLLHKVRAIKSKLHNSRIRQTLGHKNLVSSLKPATSLLACRGVKSVKSTNTNRVLGLLDEPVIEEYSMVDPDEDMQESNTVDEVLASHNQVRLQKKPMYSSSILSNSYKTQQYQK